MAMQSIQSKISTLSFVGIAGFLIFLLYIAYTTNENNQLLDKLAERSIPTLQYINTIKTATLEERNALITAIDLADTGLLITANDKSALVDKSLKSIASLSPEIAPAALAAQASFAQYTEAAQEYTLAMIEGNTQEKLDSMQRNLLAATQKYDLNLAHLKSQADSLVISRLQATKNKGIEARNLGIITGLFAITLICMLAGYVLYAIRRSLNNAIDIANRIAQGDYTKQHQIEVKDETSRLLKAIETMRDKIAESQHTLNVSASFSASLHASDKKIAYKQSLSTLREMLCLPCVALYAVDNNDILQLAQFSANRECEHLGTHFPVQGHASECFETSNTILVHNPLSCAQDLNDGSLDTIKQARYWPIAYRGTCIAVLMTTHSHELEEIDEKLIQAKMSEFSVIINNFLLDEARQKLLLQLENTVSELQVSRDRALAADAAKSQFLANMSHEIRTPMNAIVGFNQLLSEMVSDPEQQHMLSRVNSASEHLLTIINDLLDLAKIDSGEYHIDNSSVNLQNIETQLIAILGEQAKRNANDLLLTIAPDVPLYLISDAKRLMQVLTNLVSNAIKFTHNGTINLDIKMAQSKRYTDTLNKNEAYIQFSVQDSGIGIAPEDLAGLFERFTQVDDSVTRKFGGTGLGLSISKEIVNILGGEIWVSSQPEQGSCFNFTLRICLPTEKNAAHTCLASRYKNERILVASGKKLFADALLRCFESHGMRGAACYRMKSLTESIKAATPPTIIIIDESIFIQNKDTTADCLDVSACQLCIILEERNSEPARSVKSDKNNIRFASKPIIASQLIEAINNDDFAQYSLTKQALESSVLSEQERLDSLQNTHVLLAEDIATNQLLAKKILTNNGIKVMVVKNGQEAVDAVQSLSFDAVLMDINMPEMSGIEATAIIRNELHKKDLPIIALTAITMDGDKEKCLNAGMNDYVSKPFNVGEMLDALSSCIIKSRIDRDHQHH